MMLKKTYNEITAQDQRMTQFGEARQREGSHQSLPKQTSSSNNCSLPSSWPFNGCNSHERAMRWWMVVVDEFPASMVEVSLGMERGTAGSA